MYHLILMSSHFIDNLNLEIADIGNADVENGKK